jgi:hypothetical protein
MSAPRCSTWKKADHHLSSGTLVSRCGGGVELQVRPYDHFARPKGESGYVVKYNGRIVRHGSARTLAAAKRAARKQAGATGGVP